MQKFTLKKSKLVLLALIFQGNYTLEAYSQHLAYSGNVVAAKPSTNQEQPAVATKSLVVVLKELESVYKVSFNYNSDQLDGKQVKEGIITAKAANLEKTLITLLSPLGLKYEKINRNFYLIVKDTEKEPDKTTLVKAGKGNVVDITLTGKVVDPEGQPLPGVSILLKGTNIGAATDIDGSYRLNVPDNMGTLIFSYIGFVAQEVAIGNQTTINVTLRADAKALEEVVVIGYGTQKRENVIGSIGQVSSEQINNRPVTQLKNALTGQIPGVTITQDNGRPGVGGGNIRVRGVGSFGAAPDALILVDGIPTASFNEIDPNDVESISVLKDASSAAIYGARAANGVILVTTKSGKEGKTTVSYNGYVGVQKPTAVPDFLDSWDYAAALNVAENKTTPTYSDQDIEAFRNGTNLDQFPNSDFLNAILTKNGTQTAHNFTVSGGTATNNYNLSLGYLFQDGIVIKNNYNRYNVRLNMKTALSPKFDLTTRLAAISSTRNEPGTGVVGIIDGAVKVPSSYVGIYSNGNFGEGIGNTGTPIANLARESYFKNKGLTMNGNLRLDYKVIQDLKFSGIASYVQTNGSERRFAGTQNVGLNNQIVVGPNTLNVESNASYYYTLQGLADYNKRFDKHQINLLLGYSFEANQNEKSSAYRANFPNNQLTEINVGSPEGMNNSGTASEWAIESQFARANYSYANKYLIEGVVRRDGSSRFPTNNKYAVFPSVAVGWRIGQESFVQDNLPWISELKIKASRGVLGNQNIVTNNVQNYYPYQNTLGVVGAEPGSTTGTNYSYGGNIVQGVARTQLVDSTLHWESTRTTDVGTEFGFFNNKLTGSATYFHRYSYDILVSPGSSVSNVLGFGLSQRNSGELKNTGWEFTLGHTNNIGKFSYNIAGNFSIINNEVLDLGVGNVIQPNGMIGNGSDLFIGYPLNLYYGLVADGLYVDQADIDAYTATNNQSTINAAPQPGDIRYKDLSGPNGVPDGKVDLTYDRIYLGSQIPKYTYGLNLGANYAGFDFSMLLQGVAGVSAYLNNDWGWAFYNGANIQRWQYEERWTPENPNRDAGYPRLEIISNAGTANASGAYNSSFWLIDGSYLRIKNVQIGYTLPKLISERVKISRARVYVTGENLHTFSNYRQGWDPEINGNANFYPILANFTFGVNLTL